MRNVRRGMCCTTVAAQLWSVLHCSARSLGVVKWSIYLEEGGWGFPGVQEVDGGALLVQLLLFGVRPAGEQ